MKPTPQQIEDAARAICTRIAGNPDTIVPNLGVFYLDGNRGLSQIPRWQIFTAHATLALESLPEREIPVVDVIPNHCTCHPETCCCADYQLTVNGEWAASGSWEGMDRLRLLLDPDHRQGK